MDYKPKNIKRRFKCSNCANKAVCKRICRTVENYLQKKGGGRKYSDRHIRRKEVPFDPNFLDTQMPAILKHKRTGGLVNTKPPDIDN